MINNMSLEELATCDDILLSPRKFMELLGDRLQKEYDAGHDAGYDEGTSEHEGLDDETRGMLDQVCNSMLGGIIDDMNRIANADIFNRREMEECLRELKDCQKTIAEILNE